MKPYPQLAARGRSVLQAWLLVLSHSD